MKTPVVLFALAAVVSLAGCASSTSPLATQAPSGISAGQVLGLAAGTGAGAAIGDAIGGTKGAIIGGATGLVGSALVENYLAKSKSSEVAEAEAKGEQKGRVEVFEQMWDEEARAPGKPGSAAAVAAQQNVAYPAQTVESVEFAPRNGTQAALSEPAR